MAVRGRPRLHPSVKAFRELPLEAREQIENVLSDENKTLQDVDIPFLVKEAKWTIERMKMDAREGDRDFTVIRTTVKMCSKFIKKYEVKE